MSLAFDAASGEADHPVDHPSNAESSQIGSLFFRTFDYASEWSLKAVITRGPPRSLTGTVYVFNDQTQSFKLPPSTSVSSLQIRSSYLCLLLLHDRRLLTAFLDVEPPATQVAHRPLRLAPLGALPARRLDARVDVAAPVAAHAGANGATALAVCAVSCAGCKVDE